LGGEVDDAEDVDVYRGLGKFLRGKFLRGKFVREKFLRGKFLRRKFLREKFVREKFVREKWKFTFQNFLKSQLLILDVELIEPALSFKAADEPFSSIDVFNANA
jgi:hypothetical protein